MNQKFLRFCLILASALVLFTKGEARPAATIKSKDVHGVLKEIFREHALYKEFSEEIARRSLKKFIDEIDPSKTYFVEKELKNYLEPSPKLIKALVEDYKKASFKTYAKVHALAKLAIERRRLIDSYLESVGSKVEAKWIDFRKAPFVESTEMLIDRIAKIHALQVESAKRVSGEALENFKKGLKRARRHWEDQILGDSKEQSEAFLYTYVIKSIAGALDSQTSFFTPREARIFVSSMQQKLFGIGVQLRDDFNGLTITEIIPGGPADQAKTLQVGDRIIAVDGEPIVGLHIIDAVEKIRGRKGEQVELTLMRQAAEVDKKVVSQTENESETLQVKLIRGEIVFKEERLKVESLPFGSGHIGHLSLSSFYEDETSSSTKDIASALEHLQAQRPLQGVILDLRGNGGGLIGQAVQLAGLFLDPGIIVSLKDAKGKIQHLRHLGYKKYSGPLVILIDPLSASCSEIVAGTLREYGRALVVGDRSYGKGSFQLTRLDLNAGSERYVRDLKEYKVTSGTYHTVSGKTPQLVGIKSDIEVLGPLAFSEVGERFTDYPLENCQIEPSYEDALSDISLIDRPQVRRIYRAGVQKVTQDYSQFLTLLDKNSKERLANSKAYQSYIEQLKKQKEDQAFRDYSSPNHTDFQLEEAAAVLKDLLYLMKSA